MRILRKQIDKTGQGLVKLVLEEPEDLYHAYNLISVGDYVRCSTVRKVVQESSTGSVQSSRTRLSLTIEVERVDYEPGSSELRVMGKNKEENPFVKLGANHTLELEITRDFTLRKACWDRVFLERLDNVTNLANRSEVAAVVLDTGTALVCLVTEYMTMVQSKIESSIPKKRGGDASAHDKGVDKFFTAVLDSLVRNIEISVVKCIIVASPGYVKDDFANFVDRKIQDATASSSTAELATLRKKFLLVHSSSGHKNALLEVLAKPEVQLQMKETKAALEVQALDKFFETLHTDEHRVTYGITYVRAALDENAVEILLVCDDLFRAANPLQRQRYVKIVDDAKNGNAKVFIFSKLHVSGEQLAKLSGIAAILRYPMPHLHDLVETEKQQESSDQLNPSEQEKQDQFVLEEIAAFDG